MLSVFLLLENQFSRVVTEHSLCSCRAQTESTLCAQALTKRSSTVCKVSAFLCISSFPSPRNKSHACCGGKKRNLERVTLSTFHLQTYSRVSSSPPVPAPLACIYPFPRYNGDKNPPMGCCRYPASAPNSRPFGADWSKMESNNNQRVQWGASCLTSFQNTTRNFFFFKETLAYVMDPPFLPSYHQPMCIPLTYSYIRS